VIKAEPRTQQRIAQALFKSVDVLGPLQVWVHPSEEAEAHGWATAMHGEFERKVRRYGRGERTRAYTFQVAVTIVDGGGDSIVSRSSDVA
jgi:hypothetical protein